MFTRSLMLGCIVCCGMSGFAVSDEVQATKPVVHKLAKTFVVWGSSDKGIIVATGYSNIDSPMTITCAGPNGCTFMIDAMVGIKSASTDSSAWSICAMVDGVLVSSQPCVSQGTFSPQTVTGNSRQSIQVAKGKHTVQTQLYVQRLSGKLLTWHITYSVFRP